VQNPGCWNAETVRSRRRSAKRQRPKFVPDRHLLVSFSRLQHHWLTKSHSIRADICTSRIDKIESDFCFQDQHRGGRSRSFPEIEFLKASMMWKEEMGAEQWRHSRQRRGIIWYRLLHCRLSKHTLSSRHYRKVRCAYHQHHKSLGPSAFAGWSPTQQHLRIRSSRGVAFSKHACFCEFCSHSLFLPSSFFLRHLPVLAIIRFILNWRDTMHGGLLGELKLAWSSYRWLTLLEDAPRCSAVGICVRWLLHHWVATLVEPGVARGGTDWGWGDGCSWRCHRGLER